MRLSVLVLLALALPGVSLGATGQAAGKTPNPQISGNASATVVTATGSTTARPLQDRHGEVANVKDFGAKCDRTTDDTAAIRAAVNSLPLNTGNVGILSPRGYSNGGTVLFPRGGCKVTGTISLRRGVRVTGVGREASQILSFTAGSVFQYLDAGRDVQDEIAIENLSIWQDATVPATSGAGVEVNIGPAASQSVSLRASNLLIVGTYHCITLQAAIASSVRDSFCVTPVSDGLLVDYSGASPTATTSTSFQNVYASGSQTANGFKWINSSYSSCIDCGSDSNATYGYYVDGGSGMRLFVGAEQNTSGGIYLKNTQGMVVQPRIVTTSGLKHGISLESAGGTTILSPMFSSDAGTTGYAVHVVTPNAGGTIMLGFNGTGGHLTNIIDNPSYFLALAGYQSGYFTGGLSPNYAIGNGNSVDSAVELSVAGAAGPTTNIGIKAAPTFTATSATVAAITAQPATNNTAVNYPVVMGLYAPPIVKGASSTVPRAISIVADRQTSGSTANAAISVCTVNPAAGTWGVASACADDSYFTGPLRLGGSAGPRITSGTAAPGAGTWGLGDRVFNSSPAVGQPKSWVCTVAGSPGTWVSEGNL